jgi:DNA-binding MarR family transcriptional regulator/GNAT superfamily N-acetyltransferase
MTAKTAKAAEAAASETERQITSVRSFNRFYTRQIGVLQEGYLKGPFSLAEVRVLYELAHQDEPTATAVGRELGLDAGYLSRILRGFQQRDLVQTRPSEADGRQSLLSLTEAGREVFGDLDERAREDVGALLSRLTGEDRRRLMAAMGTIETLLSERPEPKVPYVLRPHRPGDMGWVVERHGVLYAEEYGWDGGLEALTAEVVARFLKELDPRRERCWIAEREGRNVGCVFLVRASDTVSQLRLLLVEPEARGLGIGRRLIAECIRFARQAGYHRMTLWTNHVLDAARYLYEEAGFQLVHEEAHTHFGPELRGQTWEREL